MGLRDRLKKIANRFSGEYSDAAPEGGPTPYSRDGSGADETTVLKARLKRPREQRDEDESDASS